MNATIKYPQGYQPNIAYQTYATHKEIIAVHRRTRSQGNTPNFYASRNVKVDNKTNGKFSQSARNRLKENIYNWAVTLFLIKAKYKHNESMKKTLKYANFQFITLTLPQRQMHSDYTIKARLTKFLIVLRKSLGYDFNYTWRAETQQNGNIHFHLLFDHYFPIWLLIHTWNDELEYLGYLSGLEYINAQCVNVKVVKTMYHVWHYLRKYCAKHSYKTRRGIEGHNWGSSLNIKRLNGKMHQQMTSDEWYNVLTKAIQKECSVKYINDFVTIIYLNQNKLSDITSNDFVLKWLTIIKDNYDILSPILVNYQFKKNYTNNDYVLKHNWKFNYLCHNSDTPHEIWLEKHYPKELYHLQN